LLWLLLLILSRVGPRIISEAKRRESYHVSRAVVFRPERLSGFQVEQASVRCKCSYYAYFTSRHYSVDP
jgi:hypothetical protein